MSTWFLAMYLLTQSKNNVSALELSRHLGGATMPPGPWLPPSRPPASQRRALRMPGDRNRKIKERSDWVRVRGELGRGRNVASASSLRYGRLKRSVFSGYSGEGKFGIGSGSGDSGWSTTKALGNLRLTSGNFWVCLSFNQLVGRSNRPRPTIYSR